MLLIAITPLFFFFSSRPRYFFQVFSSCWVIPERDSESQFQALPCQIASNFLLRKPFTIHQNRSTFSPPFSISISFPPIFFPHAFFLLQFSNSPKGPNRFKSLVPIFFFHSFKKPETFLFFSFESTRNLRLKPQISQPKPLQRTFPPLFQEFFFLFSFQPPESSKCSGSGISILKPIFDNQFLPPILHPKIRKTISDYSQTQQGLLSPLNPRKGERILFFFLLPLPPSFHQDRSLDSRFAGSFIGTVGISLIHSCASLIR